MEAFWFVVVTVMLAIYVMLDGFDFGTGIVYLFVAKTEPERRMALAAIGPVWTANEVWLIAAGGLLFFAFPRAYAAGFSGFYLALIMVLWLFIFRGLALELRGHIDHVVWRQFWDFSFSVASLLLAIVFGAALGNLIRGVPLNAEGYFFAALWTDFSPGPQPGILDWYTVLMAVTSVAILAMHGANYLAMKTEGALAEHAGRIGEWGGWVAVGFTVAAAVATHFVQPGLLRNYDAHPIGYVLPLMGIASLAGVLYCRRARRDGLAFAASSVLILGWLGSAAWGLFPQLLIATTHPTHSLTIYNAAATPYGLQVGLLWFLPGFALALTYTIIAHRAFWGKVNPRDFEAGH
jgi:cytochrome d ubiquinol oxidase subunit II